MGLCLFPGDGESDGPDACFSYGEFALFRRRLALAEDFHLEEMQGFGGVRPWKDVRTALEPLLNHPDDHSRSLSPLECEAIVARLENILLEWVSSESSDFELKEHIRDARKVIAVMHVCIQKNVELCLM
ncbi:hypothetical protein Ssi02_65420 [Sinosporangium siamense]|uniref:Uncharacterized protein n=1 Tax=Sinosporangium siamense TaxID=1367973 RepID=A0A919RQ01_9ACTN|nr:hypothetical protein Ssi02_65420 [Sinosporangium siamense]